MYHKNNNNNKVKKLWHMKVTMIPIAIGAIGKSPKIYIFF